MKNILLKGHNFTLRPYKTSDTIFLTENSLSKKPDLKESEKWLRYILKENKKNLVNFAICVDDKAVGHIGGNFEKDHIFTVWYWLGNKFHGKGIATEAVKLYTKYLLKNFKVLKRIQAETKTDNEPSKRVLEKNNFKLEGILRKKENFHGKLVDKCMFSKLRGEK